MEKTEKNNIQVGDGVEKVNTLFDSDLAEYEWIQEQKEKNENEKKRIRS